MGEIPRSLMVPLPRDRRILPYLTTNSFKRILKNEHISNMKICKSDNPQTQIHKQVPRIAATLSSRSPFLSPFDKRDEADAAKRQFTVGQSDHLAVLKAYTEFDQISGQAKFEFARENFLGIKSLQAIAGLKRQLLELLSDAHFVPAGLGTRSVARYR